jgi:hypothetical protein
MDGSMNGAMRFGDRWIAGGGLSVGPTLRAAVWISDDGVSWSDPIVIGPEPVEQDGIWTSYWINGFGQWDGDLLAFGWHGYGGGDGGYAMLWTSANGEDWSVVDTAGTAFGDEYHFPQTSSVAPDGQLAVFSGTGLGSGMATFLSPDLAAWETHPIAADDQPTYAVSVAVSPSMLIGVNFDQPPFEAGDDLTQAIPHAWVSSDARTWTTISPPVERGTLTDIAWDSANDQFVAVGTDADGLPFAWLTTDGSSWTDVPLGAEPAYMNSVVAAGGLIAASGETGSGLDAEEGDTIVWSSHDGASWASTTVLSGRIGTVAAATSTEIVLVTHRFTQSGDESWQSIVGTATTGGE